ncbi:MAG: hypothetical protein LUG98_15640 [Tannerellaceae bacterium]|nr:hypothetical protein [Tannerellaceae bacterium]
MKNRKGLLFIGLALLALAGFILFLGLPSVIGWVLLGAAICFKSLFLLFTFRAPGFRMSAGMYMILAGVGLILLSLLFKNIYPMPLVRNLLFYSAITLKVGGVCLLLYRTRK